MNLKKYVPCLKSIWTPNQYFCYYSSMKKLVMHTNDEVPSPSSKNIIICKDGYVGIGVYHINTYRQWWTRCIDGDASEVNMNNILYWYEYDKIFTKKVNE